MNFSPRRRRGRRGNAEQNKRKMRDLYSELTLLLLREDG